MLAIYAKSEKNCTKIHKKGIVLNIDNILDVQQEQMHAIDNDFNHFVGHKISNFLRVLISYTRIIHDKIEHMHLMTIELIQSTGAKATILLHFVLKTSSD